MKTLLNVSAISALLLSTSSFAATTTVNGGTVHFVGELVNAACAVHTDSADQTVNLGQYRTASLAGVNSKTTPVPFEIKLVDCDPTIAATAAVAFNGQSATGNVNLLAVSAGGSNQTAAKNVGIEIADSTSKILAVDGSTFSTPKNLIAGDNTLNFSARYVSVPGGATPGQANADATFVVKYE
ncbi:type 1 fimbrial major subunit FimA [Acinetobacter nematophilus]|uniref:type 1 fimbrial major subunit FimA n=1 Tax=Acinetobacter nematophilus TaxID=2994642 RepID=UPI003AF6BABD